MSKFKSVLDEIQERLTKEGRFRIIPREEVFPIYREIYENMQKWERQQTAQEFRAKEKIENLILRTAHA